jgi:hypothetical protein
MLLELELWWNVNERLFWVCYAVFCVSKLLTGKISQNSSYRKSEFRCRTFKQKKNKNKLTKYLLLVATATVMQSCCCQRTTGIKNGKFTYRNEIVSNRHCFTLQVLLGKTFFGSLFAGRIYQRRS